MTKHQIKNSIKSTNHAKSYMRGITNNKKKLQISVIIFICVVILILMMFFVLRTYNHYIELKSHREYFKQQNSPIQDWMTIHSIVKYYHISENQIYSEMNVSPGTLISELGMENTTVVDRLTIKTICIQKNLDCNSVVNELNNIRAK